MAEDQSRARCRGPERDVVNEGWGGHARGTRDHGAKHTASHSVTGSGKEVGQSKETEVPATGYLVNGAIGKPKYDLERKVSELLDRGGTLV